MPACPHAVADPADLLHLARVNYLDCASWLAAVSRSEGAADRPGRHAVYLARRMAGALVHT
jgi:hypothetical protein